MKLNPDVMKMKQRIMQEKLKRENRLSVSEQTNTHKTRKEIKEEKKKKMHDEIILKSKLLMEKPIVKDFFDYLKRVDVSELDKELPPNTNRECSKGCRRFSCSGCKYNGLKIDAMNYRLPGHFEATK